MSRTADTLTAAFATHGWTQRTDGVWSRPTAHGDQLVFVYWSTRGSITMAARHGVTDRDAVTELGPRVANKLARLVDWITEPAALAPDGGGLEVIQLRTAAARRDRIEAVAAPTRAAMMTPAPAAPAAPRALPAHALTRGHSVTVDAATLTGRWGHPSPITSGSVDGAVTSVSTLGASTTVTVAVLTGAADYPVPVALVFRAWRGDMVTLTPGARLPGAAGIATPAQLHVDALDAQRRLDDALDVAVEAGFDVDQCVDGYIDALLWTQRDDDAHLDDCPVIEGGDDQRDACNCDTNLDAAYDRDDVAPAARAAIEADVVALVSAHPLAVRMYLDGGTANNGQRFDSSQFGHDFLLTRDGHGTGYWDRGLGAVGDYLTAAVTPYGDHAYLTRDADTGRLH